jgi:hypothetical protein
MDEYGVVFTNDELIGDIVAGKTRLVDIVTDPITGERRSMHSVSGLITIEVYKRLTEYFDTNTAYDIMFKAQKYGKYIAEDNSVVLIYSGGSNTWMIIADSDMYNGMLRPGSIEQGKLSTKNRLENLKLMDGRHLSDYQIGIILASFQSIDKTDEQEVIGILARELLSIAGSKKK